MYFVKFSRFSFSLIELNNCFRFYCFFFVTMYFYYVECPWTWVVEVYISEYTEFSSKSNEVYWTMLALGTRRKCLKDFHNTQSIIVCKKGKFLHLSYFLKDYRKGNLYICVYYSFMALYSSIYTHSTVLLTFYEWTKKLIEFPSFWNIYTHINEKSADRFYFVSAFLNLSINIYWHWNLYHYCSKVMYKCEMRYEILQIK